MCPLWRRKHPTRKTKLNNISLGGGGNYLWKGALMWGKEQGVNDFAPVQGQSHRAEPGGLSPVENLPPFWPEGPLGRDTGA